MKKMILFMQGFVLTRWIWSYWQHEDTGYIALLPFWENPGKRWYRFNYKE